MFFFWEVVRGGGHALFAGMKLKRRLKPSGFLSETEHRTSPPGFTHRQAGHTHCNSLHTEQMSDVSLTGQLNATLHTGQNVNHTGNLEITLVFRV